jgi:hypothetical protein
MSAPVTKLLYRFYVGFGSLFCSMEVRLRKETQPGPFICVTLTIYIPPPPHLSADIRGELYKLSPEDSSVLSIAVGWFCDTLVLTSSSSSASATTSPIYIIH